MKSTKERLMKSPFESSSSLKVKSSLNPWSETIRPEMERLMNDFPFSPMAAEFDFAPRCGIEETSGEYRINFDLPGVAKEAVKVEMLSNRLRVSGERKKDHREESGGYKSEERYYGRFQREFTIPENIDSTKVEAQFQDGELKISLPKITASKTHRVEITDGRAGNFGRAEDKMKDKPNSKNAA
jgi:HSP20 family protein